MRLTRHARVAREDFLDLSGRYLSCSSKGSDPGEQHAQANIVDHCRDQLGKREVLQSSITSGRNSTGVMAGLDGNQSASDGIMISRTPAMSDTCRAAFDVDKAFRCPELHWQWLPRQQLKVILAVLGVRGQLSLDQFVRSQGLVSVGPMIFRSWFTILVACQG